MSFWDDLGDAIDSIGGSMRAPFGVAMDLAGTPLGNAKEGLLWALRNAQVPYNELISQPIATASIQLGKTWQQGPGVLISPSDWSRAYRTADDVSWAQAYFAAGGAAYSALLPGEQAGERIDFGSEESIERFVRETPGGTFVTGTADLLGNFFLDPTVVVGKAAKVARLAGHVAPVRKPADVKRLLGEADPEELARGVDSSLGAARLERFLAFTEGKTAQELMQHKVIRESPEGALLAQMLAGKSRAEQKFIMRVALGDRSAVTLLDREHADLRVLLDNAQREAIPELGYAMVTRSPSGELSLFNDEAKLEELNELVAQATAREEALDSFFKVAGTAQTRTPSPLFGPIQNRLAEIRGSGQRGELLFQKTLSHIPVRLYKPLSLGRLPSGFIDFNRPSSEGVDELARLTGLVKDQIGPQQRQAILESYARATTESERMGVTSYAEGVIFGALAKRHGFSKEQAQRLLDEGRVKRSELMRRTKMTAYTGDPEVQKLTTFINPDDGIAVAMPVLDTQLANAVPLLDVRHIDKTLRRNRRIAEADAWIRGGGAATRGLQSMADAAIAFADTASVLWKTSVLMRLGYPIRNLGDDSFRIWAKVGAMAHVATARPGLRNWIANGLKPNRLSDDATILPTGKLQAEPGKGLKVREKGGKVKRRQGFGPETYRGVEFQGAFGLLPEDPNAFLGLTGDAGPGIFDLARAERNELASMRATMANARTFVGTEEGWEAAYINAVNNQIRKSPVAKAALDGDITPAQLATWIRTTEEGRNALHRMHFYRDDPEQWAAIVIKHVESAIPPDNPLWEIAKRRNITRADIKKHLPDAANRPVINGAISERDLLGEGNLAKLDDLIMGPDGFVSKTFKVLSQMPSNALARHPLFNILYRHRMQQQIDVALGFDPKDLEKLTPDELTKFNFPESLTAAEIRRFEKNAREHALREIKRTLYDISTKSHAAHTLRFVAPFFGAWQNSIGRWAGLAMQNPAVIARGVQVWNSVNRNLTVVDRDGNRKPVAGGITDDEFIRMQMPEVLQRALFGTEGMGIVDIPKNSFNITLQGDPWYVPGFGPMVQFPVNQVVLRKPDWYNELKLVLPFGPVGGSVTEQAIDIGAPSIVKRVISALDQDDSDRKYAVLNLAQAATAEFQAREGKLPNEAEQMQILRDAENAATKFMLFRGFVNLTSPVSVLPRSDYQLFIEEYRRLRADPDPEIRDHADEMFLEKYGRELYVFTASLSRNNTGVPASQAAIKAQQRHADLIAQVPEMGSLIVGSVDGTYDPAAYQYQKNTRIYPGGPTFRESRAPIEALQENQANLGWIEYVKINQLIDAERIERGLPNLRVKQAEDLAVLKQALTQQLLEQNPAFAEEFGKRDTQKNRKVIKNLMTILSDPKIQRDMPNRVDLQMLTVYLMLRQQVSAVLQSRRRAGGSADINAVPNADVRAAWGTVTGMLTEYNIRFGEIYTRWLENDDLAPVR